MSGRLQRTIQWLIESHGTITTRQVMRLGYAKLAIGTDSARQSSHTSAKRYKLSDNRSRATRRACAALGLIRLRRTWPDGIVWGLKPGTDIAQRLPITRKGRKS